MSITVQARVHSSRMRTVRCSGRLERGELRVGGICPGGWCLPGGAGVCLGGVCPTGVHLRPCKVLTSPDLYLNQAFLITRTRGRTGDIPVGEISRPQAVNVVVIEQSLGSWSRLWSLSNVSGCGSTSLFGSRAGTHQIRDQSRALEDRNDRNNSFRGVHT